MKSLLGVLVGGAALMAIAAPASATFSTQGQATPMITYTSAAAITAGRTYGSYDGVGSLFVTVASTATTGLGYLCTGALTSSNTVLTAGHCLYNYNEDGDYDPVTAISFYLPSRGEATPASTYTASSWEVNPDYNGDVTAGSDLSMFTLSTLATGHTTYSLYGGDPLQQFTRVGTGTVGGPGGTGTGVSSYDFDQRQGNNLYEYYGDEFFSDVTHNILLSDFDDGNEAHDVFGQAGGNVQTGIPGESDSSPGDSGGPEFIDGQIVGITSFGVTGAVVDGSCGSPSDIDPYAAGQSCTNSSVGEIAGDTWALPYSNFINNYIRNAAPGAVPEPSSWAVFMLGFGVLGSSMRLRNRANRMRAAI
jgi:hypothetical protein